MIKIIVKLLIIGIISISFIACEDKKIEEKEVKFTPKLLMPEVKEEYINKYFKLSQLYNAKDDPIPAMKIGYAYSEKLHDYEKALEWYKYADSMIPLGENSYFACYALQQLKRYDEAISWCQKAIDLKWDEALFRMGKVLELKKEFNQAIEFYKQSFEKNKDKVAANNLGLIYSLELKKYDEAEQWFRKSIQEGYELAYKNFAIFYHNSFNDDIKASAYAIAVIDTKYTKSSVLKLLQNEMKIPNETIKKGYELQLTSDEFPIKYKGELGL
ncbi:tetratricopeptide repeat protein [Halarcobacter anaerophilus]|uniref:Uncharacterized protein n=1 Tax=Halarcobacter anaerophilus TaxID=877500 RepID=A0A4Q0Y1P6_9BACT|nr:tetratricopeptide repeat protein [Halarcobacter anaerophilus]QDF27567.1 tetratricopeptide repeat protein [Halarcobacter anaerophilus]RXJ63922.1 hypothetical protein CRV06_02975 [Halarcobacter anaerophilus]